MSSGASTNDLCDTIVAIAAGQQMAHRGIVRLSGPQVHRIVQRCFQPRALQAVQLQTVDAPLTDAPLTDAPLTDAPLTDAPLIDAPQRLTGARRMTGRFLVADTDFGSVSSGDGPTRAASLPVDCWIWWSSRSYTGQPSAEFHLAGIPFLLRVVMQQCVAAGARVAAPGEFTMRAFLAGRLDLLQAQAVLQVVEAQSPAQLQRGLAQLAGGLSSPLQRLREQLIHLLAHLEAGLDFVEEDIEFISRETLLRELGQIETEVAGVLDQLRERGEAGRLPRVVLVGPPNAGKSSLYNALAGAGADARAGAGAGAGARAIVSPMRGTTRDFLSCSVQLGRREIELIDTAGLESVAADLLEPLCPSRLGLELPTSEADDLDRLGQQQAWLQIPNADVLVLCWDIQENVANLGQWIRLLPKTPALIVFGKYDLTGEVTDKQCLKLSADIPTIQISAQTGYQLEILQEIIETRVGETREDGGGHPGLLSLQAEDELLQIQDALRESRVVTESGGGEELVAAEIHRAIDRLGRLVGTIYTDDILDSIFSRFCIGK